MHFGITVLSNRWHCWSLKLQDDEVVVDVGEEDRCWLCCNTTRTCTKGAWSWWRDKARHHCLGNFKNITTGVTVSETSSFKDSVYHITRWIVGNGNNFFAVWWNTYLMQWSLNKLVVLVSYYLFNNIWFTKTHYIGSDTVEMQLECNTLKHGSGLYVVIRDSVFAFLYDGSGFCATVVAFLVHAWAITYTHLYIW